jgi:hypothetical protein
LELTCGAPAANHLEPYSPEICGNFEVPSHFGRMIAFWDRPEFVPAATARHLRDDDYVVGLIYKGLARAYPLWIVDNYHVINDAIAGDAIVFATCERCQSGSAFLSVLDGKRFEFSGKGMYNASLTMLNRAAFERERSVWLHYEGVALHGKFAGRFLAQIPTYHTIWKDWRAAHPQTEVMIPPVYKFHRDARHGHGRDEYFARPGMESPFIQTITATLDNRYPENEMVLGVNLDQGVKAYPLREVKKSGSVVADHLGDHPIVVFAGPRPERFTMAAYSRIVDGRILSFRHAGDHFVDEETQSCWTIEGIATQGSLAGQRLTPLRWQYVRWHAWFYPHRSTELYRYEGELPVYPDVPAGLDISPFQPLLEGISKLGRTLVVEGAIINLRLPHEAEQGLSLRVGCDRLNLYLFNSDAAAADYAALQGAWFCVPVAIKVERRKSRRAGKFVLESDPEIQYADAAQIVRLPDAEIRWSDLVTDENLIAQWSSALADFSDAGAGHFAGLFQHLKRCGYDVVETAFLPHSQLRVGVVNAVSATINADHFAIYKCENDEAGERVASELSHCLRVGRWVFRSVPPGMYEDQRYEIGHLPEENIRWSKLIADQRFLAALQDYFVYA